VAASRQRTAFPSGDVYSVRSLEVVADGFSQAVDVTCQSQVLFGSRAGTKTAGRGIVSPNSCWNCCTIASC